MFNLSRSSPQSVLLVFLLSFTLIFLNYLLQGNIGFAVYGLTDEGFLWYGSLATASGQVPLRDFQSYDPGRYYWTAALSFILGDGIKALRLSSALFHVIGLFFGLLAVKRFVKSWAGLFLASLLLIFWMCPRYKFVEHSITMTGVYFAVWLLENPSLRRHFFAGVFVGIAAFFGRNHGLYNFLGLLLLIILAWFKVDKSSFIKKLVTWAFGIIAGYSPMLLMIAFLPGFFESFRESIFIMGRASLPLAPFPWWPWTINLSDLRWGTVSFYQFVLGIYRLFIPAFYLPVIFISLISSRENILNRRMLIASAFIGIFYMHHAIRSPSWGYMAQSIHPFLMAIISLPYLFSMRRLRMAAFGVIAAGCFIMSLPILPSHPFYGRLRFPEPFVRYEVAGDQLIILEKESQTIELIKQIDEKFFKKDEAVLVPSNLPIAYVILQRPSPVWEIYFSNLLLIPEELQRSMIADMEKKNVKWVILEMTSKNECEIKYTHPLMWRHIMENYSPVHAECLSENIQLLRRNE